MDKPKPLTAWFGGKARMAPIIAGKIENIPHKNFIEPFCGAAGVTMAKKPSQVEIINDLHDGLITLYRVVRNPQTCKELVRQLELTPYARNEWRYCNARWEAETDLIEKARMVYVVLSQNFVGATKGGSWSFGGPKYKGKVSQDYRNSLENIYAVCKRLSTIEIESAPALKIMQQWDDETSCLYLDPPYLPETRKKAPGSYLHEMTTADHLELLQFCLTSKSKIILSGYYSPLYVETLEQNGWIREDYEALASSAMQTVGNGLKGKGAELAKRIECLWINPAAQTKNLWNLEEAI